jgi:hypothetical protein
MVVNALKTDCAMDAVNPLNAYFEAIKSFPSRGGLDQAFLEQHAVGAGGHFMLYAVDVEGCGD